MYLLANWHGLDITIIQCKYSSNGTISGKTSWSDKNGNHEKKYSEDDFDYYGIYLPSIDKVVYPSIKFRGAKIATEVGNSATPFYWWEDFQHLTDSAEKKTYKDFNSKIRHSKTEASIKSRVKSRRVERPSKEELEKMLWEVPTTEIAKSYGVSDTAVSKWAKAYEISKPPRGYWSK